ncbi:ParB/RepB/Spo0J family partition protein [Elusimicrobium posterum]|uniref:ParB/RepB/Spo0J family partition protein n=1 Tax=Elusimicrobium posterum TaxID=3116653 RepID=UPI003C74551E
MTKKVTDNLPVELSTGNIAPADIQVVLNFRKSFNQVKLQELADNIKKVGILEPLLLREEKGKKILVCGERRLRAAKIAGLKEVPFRLLDITEAKAMEFNAFENLHREDLSPLDEAYAFKTLLSSGNCDIDDAAERVNKSKSYVYRSLKLLELPKEALDALAEGKINVMHCRHLLRLDAKDVASILKDTLQQDLTAEDLLRNITGRFGCWLQNYSFVKDKPFAGKEACTKCAQNTVCQKDLFDEKQIDSGRCMNIACARHKEKEHKNNLASDALAAKKYERMERLGGISEWSPKKYKSFPAVTENIKNKVEAEIKKHPEKFAVAYNHYEDKPVLFIKDEMLAKSLKVNIAQKPEEEKLSKEDKEFLEKKEHELFKQKTVPMLAGVKNCKKLFIDALVEDNDLDMDIEPFLEKIIGIKKITEKDVLKLDENNLFKLILLAKSGFSFWPNDFELFGIDGRKIEKECEKEALRLLKERQKTAAAAPAKTTKKEGKKK